MRYQGIPARECLNEGPILPMMLTIHPVYKSINWLTAPLSSLEAFTRTYLRVLVRELPCLITTGVPIGYAGLRA